MVANSIELASFDELFKAVAARVAGASPAQLLDLLTTRFHEAIDAVDLPADVRYRSAAVTVLLKEHALEVWRSLTTQGPKSN